MDDWKRNFGGVGVCLLLVLLAAGCGPVRKQRVGLCPPAQSVEQATQRARENAEKIEGVASGGKLVIRVIEDGREVQKESLDLTLRFWKRDFLFLRGNSLVGEVLRTGMNEDEFWHRKNIAGDIEYIWGSRERIDECGSVFGMELSHLVEMMGIVEFDAAYLLTEIAENMDYLYLENEYKLKQKTIWLDQCDGLVRRVEYFNRFGDLATSFDLNEYEALPGGGRIPTKMVSFQRVDASRAVEFTVELRGVKDFVPTQRQLEKGLFERPETQSADRLYQLGSDCEFKQIK